MTSCIQNLLTAQFTRSSILKHFGSKPGKLCFRYTLIQYFFYIRPQSYKERLSNFDTLKTDKIQLQDLIRNCNHLKYKFLGVFAADNFPPHIPNNIFMIVNTSNSDSLGTHWIVIYNSRNVLYYADPLGFPLWQYINLYKRLNEIFHKVTELMTNFPHAILKLYHLIYDKNLVMLLTLFT